VRFLNGVHGMGNNTVEKDHDAPETLV